MSAPSSQSRLFRAAVIALIFVAGDFFVPFLLRAAEVATADFDRNWPRWRGPSETGVAPHGTPPVEWSETKNIRWKVPIAGEGSASPIIWGDRIFVTSAVDTGKQPAPGAAPAADPNAAPTPTPAGAPAGAPPGRSSEDEWRFVVTALRRTDGSVIWEKTARVEKPHEGTHQTGNFAPNSAVTDGEHLYAYFVRQWELVATSGGKVRIKQVRDIKFSSQTEGCVADDRAGTLFVAEEDIGTWKVTAEPVKGAKPVSVDTVGSNAQLKDDMEGVGLYDLGNGRGYLVVSSQGNNSYAVYRREGDQAYLGSFSVIADSVKGIDGISETDGLEVSSANLGPGLENGAMVAQDGRNVLPVETQNFKVVPWKSIADALKLEVRQ